MSLFGLKSFEGRRKRDTFDAQYTYFVVVWPAYVSGDQPNTAKAGAKIESGWEYKQDAKDRYTEIVDVEAESEGPFQDHAAAVVARRTLSKFGLDPQTASDWIGGGSGTTFFGELGHRFSYGEMPSRAVFNEHYQQAFEGDSEHVLDTQPLYEIVLNKSDQSLFHIAAPGFLSKGEPVEHGKLKLGLNRGELYLLLKSLVNQGDEDVVAFASDILGTLGIEWV